MTAEWNVRRAQELCAGCGHEFEAGEALFSILRLDGGDVTRGDLCGACFDGRDPGDDLFYWRTRHRQGSGGTLRVDFELLLGVVERFTHDPRPACRDFAFLVALLLVRHRRLRLLGVLRRDGQELLQLRRVGSQVPFEVEVRALDEARRAQLTQVLAGLFDPAQEVDLEAWIHQAGAG